MLEQPCPQLYPPSVGVEAQRLHEEYRERVVRGPPHRALAQLGEYARRRGIARALKDEPPRRAKDRLRQPARQLWNLARVRARVQATLNHLPLIGCIAALPNVRARRRERAPPRFQSDQGDRSHIEGVRRRGADAQECRRSTGAGFCWASLVSNGPEPQRSLVPASGNQGLAASPRSGTKSGTPASRGEAALRLRGPMASIVAQADLPPEDETWKAEVKKPPRDNRYQTEDVTLTKGRPRHSRRARPRPL